MMFGMNEPEYYKYYGHYIFPKDDELFDDIDGVTHNERLKSNIREKRKIRKHKRVKLWKSKSKRRKYYGYQDIKTRNNSI